MSHPLAMAEVSDVCRVARQLRLKRSVSEYPLMYVNP